MMFSTHDQLADDLAYHKGGVQLFNVCLGSAWIAKRGEKVPRADLVVIQPSYKRMAVAIYEVKLTRADLLSDLRTEKWRSYLQHCHRFYFACASGIASKDDIPSGVGLIVRDEKSWTTVKAAKSMNHDVPYETMQSLVFARQRQTLRERHIMELSEYNRLRKYNPDKQKLIKVLGKQIGILVYAANKVGGIDKAISILREKMHPWNKEEFKNVGQV